MFVSDNINGPKIAWDKNYEDKFMIQYRDEGDDAATGQQKFVKGTNASGTISFGSEITIAGSNSSFDCFDTVFLCSVKILGNFMYFFFFFVFLYF